MLGAKHRLIKIVSFFYFTILLKFRQVYNLYFSSDKEFVKSIKDICGYVPKEIFLYRLALSHSSIMNNNRTNTSAEYAKMCNERLEFLGDSILDAIVADYLFKIYPLKDEGFLTEMRSKIVNRLSLNDICKKLNIDTLIQHNQSGSINESMYGDALEAFIGAVYIDLGYHDTRQFILNKIITPWISLDKVENQVISYKNKLIEYTQKNRQGQLEFVVIEENGSGHQKTFVVQAKVGNKVLGSGYGKNKKTAEQRASEDALKRIGNNEPKE